MQITFLPISLFGDSELLSGKALRAIRDTFHLVGTQIKFHKATMCYLLKPSYPEPHKNEKI